ncbi:FAD-dependent protein [Frankia sp. Cj5]|uniref:FAD-dependent protein n=1 Tax=Frankia sp. Cj5 TaxID=2880978 RepID=UPI001EF6C989|nr:FAD-dependent monooxygenase [Frankia sp. Cj5]
MNPSTCSVLIIGAGPAGQFCADQLLQAGIDNIVIVDKGKDMTGRVCPESPSCECPLCDVLEGDGGAGSFSDGKITLSATRGTHGQTLFRPNDESLLGLIDETIRRFAPAGITYPPAPTPTGLDGPAGTAPLRFDSYPLLHVGSDGIRAFGQRYSRHLQNAGVTLLTGVEACELVIDDDGAAGAVVYDRRHRVRWTIAARAVCAATGLAGTPWLENQLRTVGVGLATGPADIGIRLETTVAALEPFISAFYDFKVAYTAPSGLAVRSFCVNGDGYVVNEYHRALGIRGVNGHSFLDRASGLSNLAILATLDETVTADPKAHVRTLAATINAATGGYPIRQHLAEFLPEGPSAPAAGVVPSNQKTRPGRLQEILPATLYAAFAGYISALAAVLPPVAAVDTVIYAPEIKYYNYRVPVDRDTWESSDVAGLYVVGNAAGYTASLSAAALTGIIAGRAIAARGRRRAASPRPAAV